MSSLKLVKTIFFLIAISGFFHGNLISYAAEQESKDFQTRIVLFPIREAIMSAMVETAVRTHKFKEGEKFNKDDLLVELNDDSFKQRLIKAKSACIEAKAGVSFSDKNVTRTKDLFKRGLQGMQDMEKSNLELEIANSKQMFQDANLELSQQDLDNCHIKAPFSGRVVKKMVQEHEFVRVGQQLIQIIDDNQLLAVMHLPSQERSKVKIGEKRSMQVDETGTTHEGSIYEIAGEIDAGSRTFEIKVLIENNDGKLTAGMTGRLLSPDESAPAQSATPPGQNDKEPVK